MKHASQNPPPPLAGVRVLDLATPLAEACGRVLADLGAEVIKPEPPGGCASRRIPPFELDAAGKDSTGENASLFWRAWGRGKRSLVLDIESEKGRAELRALLAGADVLVESFTPGFMRGLGLDYQTLARDFPALIYVSVTPYGQSGPLAKAPATDLTLAAAGGLIHLQGDKDRPPVAIGHPEASCHAAVQAAADTVFALLWRRRSGRGQHLDSSMQAAVAGTLLFALGFPALHNADMPAFGDDRAQPTPEIMPGLRIPALAKLRDGDAVLTLLLGEVGKRSLGGMMAWAAEEGALPPELARHDWSEMLELIGAGKLRPADAQRGLNAFVEFLGGKTKAEVHRRACVGKWLLAPAWNAADIAADEQLAARNYWREVAGVLHNGPFARLSKTPLRIKNPAPALGEMKEVKRPNSNLEKGAAASEKELAQLLTGLRVADFSWVGAGPLVSMQLANYGAQVLRVESEKHIDPMRLVPPWKNETPNVSTGWCMANFNQSKFGLALDLQSDGGRQIAQRLIDWADVVTESFTPGSAKKLGLDYESVRRRRPDIVMLSSCLRGQTGPQAGYTGFGLQGASLAGFSALTGWPDRPPGGPWGAYTDFIAPRFSLAALGAALWHRARTGEGQYIDLSQIEAAMHYLEPVMLDYRVNGRVQNRRGMHSRRACPHGVFRAAGAERYLAVAVESAAHWRALQRVVPGLPAEAALAELPARIAAREACEAPLAEWCAAQDAFAAAAQLQRAGVPAAPVMRATDLHRCPQLAAREYFRPLSHPHLDGALFETGPTLFSATPARATHAGPVIGQHSFEVLRDVLGYGEEEIADFAAAGALT